MGVTQGKTGPTPWGSTADPDKRSGRCFTARGSPSDDKPMKSLIKTENKTNRRLIAEWMHQVHAARGLWLNNRESAGG
jgi:hypothetical protein